MAHERIPPPPGGMAANIPPPPNALPMHGMQNHNQMGHNNGMHAGGGFGMQNNLLRQNNAGMLSMQPMTPSYRAFEFRKFNKSELTPGTQVSWSMAQKSELAFSQLQIEKIIRKRRSSTKKTAYDEYKDLKSENMQEHAKRLVLELNSMEIDRSQEWTFALIEYDERKLTPNKKDISHMRVFVKRSRKPGMVSAFSGIQPEVMKTVSGQAVNLNQQPSPSNMINGNNNNLLKPGMNNNNNNMMNRPNFGGPPNMLPQHMPPRQQQVGMPHLPPGVHQSNHLPPHMLPHGNMGPFPSNFRPQKGYRKEKKSSKHNKGRRSRRRSSYDDSSSDSDSSSSSGSTRSSRSTDSTADTDHWTDVHHDAGNLKKRMERLAVRDFRDKFRRYSTDGPHYHREAMGDLRNLEHGLRPRAVPHDSQQPIIQNFNFPSRRNTMAKGGRYRDDRSDRLSDETIASWVHGSSAFSRPHSEDDDYLSNLHRRNSMPARRASVAGVGLPYREHRKPHAAGFSPRPLSSRSSFDRGGPHHRYPRELPYNTYNHLPAPYGASQFELSGGLGRDRRASDAVNYMRRAEALRAGGAARRWS